MPWGPGAASSWGGILSKTQGSETRSSRSCLPESRHAGVQQVMEKQCSPGRC